CIYPSFAFIFFSQISLLSTPFSFFFFTATATTYIYTLSLHDALPIFPHQGSDAHSFLCAGARAVPGADQRGRRGAEAPGEAGGIDRKSTRLNSSHRTISYAVFCLKKKKKKQQKNNYKQ